VSTARAGVVVLGVAAALFAVLWLTMWLPHYVVGNDGWLFLYPIFLLLLVPILLLFLTAIVLGVIAAVRGPRRRAGVLTASGSALMLVASPVALWFGAVPW
jgi:hypothetical protein